MKHHTLHTFVWAALRPLLLLFLRLRLNFTCEKCRVPGPCLVLANHDTDWDPLLLACAFPRQMYFVASEHIFRWGLLSRILVFLLAPISRTKGSTASDAAAAMLRRLKKGFNVAMFPSGSRSWNGLSEDIFPSTGRLARISGATVITYRLDGAYFAQPRWSRSGLRRGRVTGRVVGIYPPEQLKKMSADEVQSLISCDLSCDAYELQRRWMTPYRAKRPAESLETLLCLCPKCGALGFMQSRDDRFFCRCGYELRYNKYGFFEGCGDNDAVYDNISDWDADQTAQLCLMAERAEADRPILSDTGFELFAITEGHGSTSLGHGDLSLYRDRLECCGRAYPLSELGGFTLHGSMTVNFSSGRDSFELKPEHVCCTRKYETVINYLLRHPEQ